jgi:hypothetical protein
MPIRRSQKKRSAEPRQKQNNRRLVVDPMIQEIRRIAVKLARKRIKPAHIIAWSLWRRAHQAIARRAHIKTKRQL